MKCSAAMTIFILMWGARKLSAKLKPDPAETRVRVSLQLGNSRIPENVVLAAQAEATRLFEAEGIRLDWRAPRPAELQRGERVIGIEFVPFAPAAYDIGEKENALAEARPYDPGPVNISVFSDRLSRFLLAFGATHGGKALGHVLAHEITHVLEGVARHSETGLMKARWNWRDYRVMTGMGLPFAEEDRALLQLQLRPLMAR